jgi:hypothetical protein
MKANWQYKPSNEAYSLLERMKTEVPYVVKNDESLDMFETIVFYDCKDKFHEACEKQEEDLAIYYAVLLDNFARIVRLRNLD